MINKELVQNKIQFIQQELDNLSRYQDFDFEEIVSNYEKHTMVERILERIINSALDINQHLIVESDGNEVPNDYKETFLVLAKITVFPENFAEKISKSVGLRNILAHHYTNLDEKLFYKSIKACLNDYTKYSDYILKFIKKNGN